ncbi:MAG: DUF4012 domain-containing protein, partial [Anaerolineales bacterium]|nr:DUF4012 domain-containing protein [Anaerolineales bacterium]
MPSKLLLQKKNALKIFILVLFIITTLWVSAAIYCTIGLSQNLTLLKTTINLDKPAETDLETLGAILPRLNRNLNLLKFLTRPLAPFLRIGTFLPGVGPYAAQVDPLILYAANLSQAGSLSYTALSPFLELIQDETSTADFSQYIYWIINQGQPLLVEAAQALDQADLNRQAIDPGLLPGEVKRLFLLLDEKFEPIQEGVQLLAAIPDLFGSPGQPRAYLLVAQNRDELRATGGFISAIGMVKVSAGQIATVEINDSYQVDDYSKGYPSPPEPLQRFMMAGYWVPRDANWSPDFPTAARKIQELYTLSTGQATDGVIAFDQMAVKTMVNNLGPLLLPNYPEPITAGNVEEFMQDAWEPEGGQLNQEWWQHRKDFIPQLSQAMLQALLNTTDKQALFQLARDLQTALKTGHILVYSSQPEVQTAIVQAGLDNGLHPGRGDFLLLVDSNLGFNKTDAVVERRAAYFVDLTQPGQIPAMLVLYYTHTTPQDVPCVHESSYGQGAYSDMQTRCYWDYWRVYKPPGTNLYNANQTPVSGEWLLDGQPWPGEVAAAPGEGDTRMFSGFFVLPTAQKQDISLQFTLPLDTLELDQAGNLVYRLKVQKQAGLSHLPFVLQIRPPQGFQLDPPGDPWTFEPGSGF